MSQLSDLCGAAVDAGGFAVSEVRVRELEQFSVYAGALMPEFEKGGRLAGFYFSDGGTLPEDVFYDHRPNLMAMSLMCAVDTDVPLDDMQAVAAAILKANRAFFTQRSQGGDGDWYDSFQHLIGAGHRHADILDYPFSVFLGYCRAVSAQQAREDRRVAAAVRAGRFLDDRKFKDYLKAV